jgi:hypothetical protein
MRLSAFLTLCWFPAASLVWAQDIPPNNQNQSVSSPSQHQPDLTPDQKWVEQIDGSFSIPSFTSAVNPALGLGGDINIGYRLDRTLCFLIGTGYYQYNIPPAPGATNALLAYIPLVGILRLTFGDGNFRPYVFGGAGIALNTYTQNNAPGSPIPKINEAEADFYLAPGLGFIYRFSSDMAVFLQSRVDLDFTSPKGLGIPLADPSIFIPLQAGISFFAL